jgi:hypothetical protein
MEARKKEDEERLWCSECAEPACNTNLISFVVLLRYSIYIRSTFQRFFAINTRDVPLGYDWLTDWLLYDSEGLGGSDVSSCTFLLSR